MNKIHWQDAISFIVGLWLVATPFVLTVGTTEEGAMSLTSWSFIIAGIVVLVLAGAAMLAFQNWEEWLTALVGVWVVISPWVLGFATDTALVWNAIAAGAILILMSIWTTFQEGESALF